jgi:hypothetical protein
VQVIDNATAGSTSYTDALTLDDPGAVAGAYVVANSPVYAQFKQAAIADSLLLVAASSVDIQNIPATYAELVLSWLVRGDSGTLPALIATLNADAAANYEYEQVHGVGSGVGISAFGGTAQSNAFLAYIVGAADPANYSGGGVLRIPNYTSSSLYKDMTAISGAHMGTNTSNRAELITTTWKSLAAVNRITSSISAGNFVAGSRFTLKAEAAT